MLRVVVALGALLAAAGVRAQVSGNVAWTSDYRWRGISLSDNAPAVQLGLGYDHADGWYVGTLVSSVRQPLGADADVQVVTYAGYARRMRHGMSWEAGAEYALLAGASDYNYPEVYLGLASARLSGRLYYAPRYFNEDASAVYAEINGTQPLSRRLRLIGHVGWLRRGTDGVANEAERTRADAQVGLGIALDPVDVRIAWSAAGREHEQAAYEADDRSGWSITLSRAW